MYLDIATAGITTACLKALLTLKFGGYVSPGTLFSAVAATLAMGSAQRARAIKVRLDTAVISDTGMPDLMFTGDFARSLRYGGGLPVAVVVPEVHLPRYRRYQGLLAQSGVIYKPFTDAKQAADWARDLGQLVHQQASWRGRVRSSPEQRP